MFLIGSWMPRWPSGKVPASELEGFRFGTLVHCKYVVYWAGCTLNHTYGVKCPPAGVMRKFGEGMPAQVSSSSSDRGSKLRGPAQNSPRVA
ncbi:hypothetical protein AVEN_103213-1 [Araneus ventricosus]|uniref:Uncharacterized protein n=1 Tax=Araneus ventricosus TaxID=182803 RepID=A0A4Y2F6N7_ARAVE|nr:hypothetical protein AVEN_103213-1 [Araneus ventricosus]